MVDMTSDRRTLAAALAWVAEHDGELLRRLAEFDSNGQPETESDAQDGS